MRQHNDPDGIDHARPFADADDGAPASRVRIAERYRLREESDTAIARALYEAMIGAVVDDDG